MELGTKIEIYGSKIMNDFYHKIIFNNICNCIEKCDCIDWCFCE
jgi:hypothetical protein